MKCLLNVGLVLCLILSVQAQTPNLNDAVSAWLFDEGSGTTANNSVPGAPNATINGDPAWVTGVGEIGLAISFDGENDYVRVDTNPLPGAREMTVQMYIKNLNSGDEKKFFNFAADEAYKFLWEVKDKHTPGQWTPSLYLKWGGVNIFEQVSDATFPYLYDYDDQWHHVAAVVKAINDNDVSFTQYVDHVETYSATTGFDGFLSTCGIVIGARFSLDKGWFKGLIDNVVLHNRALNPEELLPKPGDVSAVENNLDNVPADFALGQNYPNPFNSQTKISYRIGNAGTVTLKVYDILGGLVETLIDEPINAGHHSISWNGKGQSGYTVPSGVYYYELEAGNFRETRRMILLR